MAGVPLIPKVTTKHYLIVLPSELAERLSKPVTGKGGWQSLLKDIQGQRDPSTPLALELPESLLHRMIPYAVKFGSGGYQGLIRWILCLVLEQHHETILGTPQTLKVKMATIPEGQATVAVTVGEEHHAD